jgi:hypothetical protein
MLFGNNIPTVSWVERLASKKSIVAENLIQALTLRLKVNHSCKLTPMQIEGKRNAILDIPSCSFRSNPTWVCMSDSDLLTLFNSLFPLPEQQSLTIYHPNCMMATRVTSILQMKSFALEGWRQLPKQGRHVGQIGAPMSNLGDWILTSNRCLIKKRSDTSQDSLPKQWWDIMERTTDPEY